MRKTNNWMDSDDNRWYFDESEHVVLWLSG
jgi:hypothetical protein